MGFDPIKQLPDLTGKVVIVTGGKHRLRDGPTTRTEGRESLPRSAEREQSESKATGALARLDSEALGPGRGQVVWLKLDLSDPKAAKHAAEDFVSKETRLDILINNPGMLLSAHVVGPLGIQETMIVNHSSPFVFTRHLLPLLTETAREPGADVRIVNVASTAHESAPDGVRFRSKADFNESYDGQRMAQQKRYGASKLVNVLWTNELQRRLDSAGTPIICISLHPGSVRTEGNIAFISKLPLGKFILWLASFFLSTPEQGACTSLIAAASPTIRADPKSYKGAYLVPTGKTGTKSKNGQSVELAVELWNSTEMLLQEMNV